MPPQEVVLAPLDSVARRFWAAAGVVWPSEGVGFRFAVYTTVKYRLTVLLQILVRRCFGPTSPAPVCFTINTYIVF